MQAHVLRGLCLLRYRGCANRLVVTCAHCCAGPPKVLKVTTVIKDGDQYTGAATFEAPRPADTADAYDRHAPYQPRERTGFTASAPPTPHQKPALDASGHAESRGEPSGAARRLKVLAAAEARTAAAAAAAAPPPRALSEDDEEEDVEEQLAAAVQAAVTQHAGLDPRAELAGMLLASNQRPVSGTFRFSRC